MPHLSLSRSTSVKTALATLGYPSNVVGANTFYFNNNLYLHTDLQAGTGLFRATGLLEAGTIMKTSDHALRVRAWEDLEIRDWLDHKIQPYSVSYQNVLLNRTCKITCVVGGVTYEFEGSILLSLGLGDLEAFGAAFIDLLGSSDLPNVLI